MAIQITCDYSKNKEKLMPYIEYTSRNCDCCDSDDLQSVWHYQTSCKTRNDEYYWDVNNVVCRHCGFAFVSPTPCEKSLSHYYTDSFSIFEGQEIDYSIEKRIQILKQCQKAINATRYLEIGSNDSPQFLARVNELFTTLNTVELNDGCTSTYKNLNDVPTNSQQVIASYFVLEHITAPKAFLETCCNILQDNGMLVIEVPNLYLYPKDPAGLMLYEHVNHFSPSSLIKLAQRCGLQVQDISLLNCSRTFGFTAVFQKNSCKTREPSHSESKSPANAAEYSQALAYLREGKMVIERFHKQVKSVRQRLQNPDQSIVIWGANAISTELLEGVTPNKNTLVVDSDPRKASYLEPITVHQPMNTIEFITKAELIIINSRRHASAITQWIKQHTHFKPDTHNIIILDY